MSRIDDLLDNARAYASTYDKGSLPMPPQIGVAVVACMDARVNIYGILGIVEGDVHVIRNAGGVITDDVIRSLTISQRLLGTTEIMLVHHADCGMRTFGDEEFKAQIERDTGMRPTWNPEAFPDAAADVRQSLNRLQANPFVPHAGTARGFVFNEQTGHLTEVTGG